MNMRTRLSMQAMHGMLRLARRFSYRVFQPVPNENSIHYTARVIESVLMLDPPAEILKNDPELFAFRAGVLLALSYAEEKAPDSIWSKIEDTSL